MTSRIAIQSDLSKNKITKLCYAIRDTYQIIRNISHGSYFVRKLNNTDSPEIATLSLQSCEHIDTTDIYYLIKRILHLSIL